MGSDLARPGTLSDAMSAMPPVCTDAATAPTDGASGSAVAEGAPGDAVHGPPRKDRAADPGGAVPRPLRIRYGTVSRFLKVAGNSKTGLISKSGTLRVDLVAHGTSRNYRGRIELIARALIEIYVTVKI